MGGKHKKYVYVRRRDGWFVKVRVLKNRSEDNPERYITVGPKVREPPITFEIIREEEIPEGVRDRLYSV